MRAIMRNGAPALPWVRELKMAPPPPPHPTEVPKWKFTACMFISGGVFFHQNGAKTPSSRPPVGARAKNGVPPPPHRSSKMEVYGMYVYLGWRFLPPKWC
ncbi:hypothetical protein KSP39_PZI013936 [Platanthera zijinensis]|uniref:Uncharacterized protein n=1 Tax=Platanthera zijinensis TaxID=2320716 RepID=A0AAP0BCE5_9ASPA